MERVKFNAQMGRLGEALSGISISRHTAVPMLRRASDPVVTRLSPVVSFGRQLLSLLVGSSFIGIAIALMLHADLGLPPYDVSTSALSGQFGISMGQAGWMLAAVFLAVAATLGRRPSLWGIGYVLANGIAIDAANGLLTRPDTLAGRWAFVVAALMVLASGVSLVVYSGTTGGPFELLMLAGEDRGISPIKIRYGLDIGVLATGIILGGSFGPATVFYALSFGLVFKLVRQALADHGEGRRSRIAYRKAEGASNAADEPTTARASGRRRRQPVA